MGAPFLFASQAQFEFLFVAGELMFSAGYSPGRWPPKPCWPRSGPAPTPHRPSRT